MASDKKFCENCGSLLPAGAHFCEECGSRIAQPDETELPRVTLPSIPTPPTSPAKPPAVIPEGGEIKTTAEPAKTGRAAPPMAGGSRKMILYAGIAVIVIVILMIVMVSGMIGERGTPPAGVVPTTKVSTVPATMASIVPTTRIVTVPTTRATSALTKSDLRYTVGDIVQGLPGDTKWVILDVDPSEKIYYFDTVIKYSDGKYHTNYNGLSLAQDAAKLEKWYWNKIDHIDLNDLVIDPNTTYTRT
jgi:ribosomal protein L40E